MDSFYGGPRGQSFYIKKIFRTKYGTTEDSMVEDLKLGFTSSVGIGEYVLISYGLPDDNDY